MNDKNLERFTTSRRADPHLPPSAVAEESEVSDLGCFGVMRGTSERAVMLELRQRTGNILAIGYGWLERIAFNPSDGITLFAAGLEILIAGRNLNREVRPNLRLFEVIARHRVPWLHEADEREMMQSPESATVIESISWKGFRK